MKKDNFEKSQKETPETSRPILVARLRDTHNCGKDHDDHDDHDDDDGNYGYSECVIY